MKAFSTAMNYPHIPVKCAKNNLPVFNFLQAAWLLAGKSFYSSFMQIILHES
jgi:hypothetical protein